MLQRGPYYLNAHTEACYLLLTILLVGIFFLFHFPGAFLLFRMIILCLLFLPSLSFLLFL